MFCDNAGRPVWPGKIVKVLDWPITNETSLPSWLVSHGSVPVVTYASPATSRGSARFQTKVAAPTSGDQAGFETAFNIDFTKFTEVGIFLYGLVTDGSSSNNQTLITANNGASLGYYLTQNSSIQQLHTLPSTTQAMAWDYSTTNAAKRKDLGVIVRPAMNRIYVASGDPREGAGIVSYLSNYNPSLVNPISVYISTQTAAQRYFEVERVKLVLNHN